MDYENSAEFGTANLRISQIAAINVEHELTNDKTAVLAYSVIVVMTSGYAMYVARYPVEETCQRTAATAAVLEQARLTKLWNDSVSRARREAYAPRF